MHLCTVIDSNILTVFFYAACGVHIGMFSEQGRYYTNKYKDQKVTPYKLKKLWDCRQLLGYSSKQNGIFTYCLFSKFANFCMYCYMNNNKTVGICCSVPAMVRAIRESWPLMKCTDGMGWAIANCTHMQKVVTSNLVFYNTLNTNAGGASSNAQHKLYVLNYN